MIKVFPKSLTGRFLLIIIIPMILIQIFCVYIFFNKHWYQVSHNININTAKEIKLLYTLCKENYPSCDYNKFIKNISKNLGFKYDVINQKYSSLKTKSTREELLSLKYEILSLLNLDNNLSYDKDEKEIVIDIPLGAKILRIIMPQKRVITPTTDLFVIWVVSASLLLLVVSIVFMKNQIRSITELVYFVDNYEKGSTFKPSGPIEIKQAGIALLKLKQKLEDLIDKRTYMLACVSHDLKTPLTRIKLALNLLDDNDDIKLLQQDVKDMEQMIGSYLDFSKGESFEAPAYVNFSKFIESIITQKFGSLKIKYNIDKNLFATIRQNAFKRAINNILDNANKYSTECFVFVKLKNDKISIEIEDNGPGIRGNKASYLEPFVRGDSARSINNSTSVGLGLNIALEIIKMHKGMLWLEDGTSLKGLKIVIVF
jgi:two-component system osmolarity sensor histidine kinase EnvZ